MPFVADEEPVGFIAEEEQVDESVPEPSAIPLPTGPSPEDLARFSAAGGGGGFVTNPSLTTREQLKGIAGNAAIAASLIAPEALVAAVPGLAPAAATGIAGYLGRLGLLGSASMGSAAQIKAAEEVGAGEKTIPRGIVDVSKQAAIGAPVGMVGGVLGQKALQSIGGGLAGLLGRQAGNVPEAVGNFVKGFKTGLLRPLFEASSDAQTRAAAELIESVTGQKPAQSLGEALGKTSFGRSYAEIERELGNEAAGSLSEEARNAITRSIMHTASGLSGSGASAGQLAELTVAALQQEIGKNISGPAKQAVSELSESLSRSLNASLAGTGAEAFKLTTPETRTTPFVAGNIGKMAEQDALKAFKESEKRLWNDYRAVLGKDVTADMSNSETTAAGILKGGLKAKNPETGQIEIVGSTVKDADARAFISEIQRAASTPQDIEVLRQYRSTIGSSIDDQNAFPGMGNANKKLLYAALSQDIDDAIAKIGDPRIKAALQKASKFTKENRPLFESNLAERAQAGVLEGGATGQSLFSSVLGDTDKYNAFKSILGDQFGPFKAAARDTVLSAANRAGASVESEAAGVFNVGAALRAIEKLPEEVSADLFPGTSSRLRELAVKELRTSKLLKGVPDNPDKVLDWVTANKVELNDFLGPNGEQKFMDALRLKAAEQARYNNAILADVARGDSASIAKDPVKFVDSILGGTYSQPGDVKAALDVVARHSPKTYHDLQVAYLSRLLNESTVKGVISGEELVKKLAAPVAGKTATEGGKAFDLSNEVLGKAKTDRIRDMAKAVATTQKSLLGKEITARGTILEMMTAGKTPVDAAVLLGAKLGVPTRSLGWYRDILNKPAQWKYQMAAKLATDPTMIPLLSKPIEELSGAEVSQLAAAVAESTRQ